MDSIEQDYLAITRFIALEGMLLDRRDWDAWLRLYAKDCEYWVPSWDDNGEVTVDPQNSLSLIYYDGRGGLEDRVHRIRTEKSAASFPLPRTSHLRSAPVVEREGEWMTASFAWSTHSFRNGRSIHYFGTRKLWMVPSEDRFLISRSHAIVANDLIDETLDVYHI